MILDDEEIFMLQLILWWTHNGHVEDSYYIYGWSNKLTAIGRYFTDYIAGLPSVMILEFDDIRYTGDIFYKIHAIFGDEAKKKIRQIKVFYRPNDKSVDWFAIREFLKETK